MIYKQTKKFIEHFKKEYDIEQLRKMRDTVSIFKKKQYNSTIKTLEEELAEETRKTHSRIN